jgi:hypothetical protein
LAFSIIGRLVASAMLCWALADHQYGYFTLLRFIVCLVAAYCTLFFRSYNKEEWTWTFGAIAVLFNPIFPFHMNRQIWNIVDILAAIVLLISLLFVKWKKANRINYKSA